MTPEQLHKLRWLAHELLSHRQADTRRLAAGTLDVLDEYEELLDVTRDTGEREEDRDDFSDCE